MITTDTLKPWATLAQDFLSAQLTFAKATAESASKGVDATVFPELARHVSQGVSQSLAIAARSSRLMAEQAEEAVAAVAKKPGFEAFATFQEKVGMAPTAFSSLLDQAATALQSAAPTKRSRA